MITTLTARKWSFLYITARHAQMAMLGRRFDPGGKLKIEHLEPTDKPKVLRVVLAYQAGIRYIRQNCWEETRQKDEEETTS